MPDIEILRTGTHVASNGKPVTFSLDHLAEMAGSYDAENHTAPIVVGHPKTDDPAYGWVKGLSVKGDRLVASVDQVDAAFAQLVRDGKFAKVSAAVMFPDANGNPTPGKFHLLHVGFLGAKAPAVKGLKPVQLAGDDAGGVTVAFAAKSDGDAVLLADWTDKIVVRLLRRLRDWFVETQGADEAEKIMPAWEMDMVQEETAAETTTRLAAPSDAEDPPTPETQEEPVANENDTAALSAQHDELRKGQEALAARQAEFQAQQDEAYVDGLIEARKLPSGLKDTVVAFMASMNGSDVIELAAGGEVTQRGALKQILDALPAMVTEGEIAGAGGDDGTRATFAAPTGYAVPADRADLYDRAVAYQRDHPGTALIDAAKAVEHA